MWFLGYSWMMVHTVHQLTPLLILENSFYIKTDSWMHNWISSYFTRSCVFIFLFTEINDEEENNNKVYGGLRMLWDSMAWWKNLDSQRIPRTPVPFSFCVFIWSYYIFFHFIYACYLMISNFRNRNISYGCKLCFKCSIKFERKKTPSNQHSPKIHSDS